MRGYVLGWVGLGWLGLGWVGLVWVGLGDAEVGSVECSGGLSGASRTVLVCYHAS